MDVNLADKKGRNALFYAVEWRHAAAASFLLERGSDVACDCDGRYGHIHFNSIFKIVYFQHNTQYIQQFFLLTAC